MKEITGQILNRRPLAGGDINEVFLLECEKGQFVQKQNRNVPGNIAEDFFKKEAQGLEELRKNGLVVPKVIAVNEESLLLEYLAPGSGDQKNEEAAGRNLALLHSVRQENYGLEYENYIGSLRQVNGIYTDWADFYISRRIEPMLKMYFKGQKNPDEKTWTGLFKWIQKNVRPEFASLLHGDIWGGNLYYSARGPVYIDPAVYRGDCMVDLAFTELFGGFSQRFYASYREQNPLPGHYADLRDLYQIYPLLVHANLFGGGYYTSALGKARKYAGSYFYRSQ